MRQGLFISIEGGDGAGKSTQIHNLTEHLREQGIDPLLLREPGGTIAGEMIRKILKSSADDIPLCPESQALLFAASRAQLVREVIQPALAEGRVVICDRFYDSTTVYQSLDGISEESLTSVTNFAVGSCIPDRTFLLDVPASVSKARITRRSEKSDRFEDQGVDHADRIRQGFLKIARQEPERVTVIDAARTPAEVSQDLQREVSILLHDHGVLKGRGPSLPREPIVEAPVHHNREKARVA